jgi:hypothetical protein
MVRHQFIVYLYMGLTLSTALCYYGLDVIDLHSYALEVITLNTNMLDVITMYTYMLYVVTFIPMG